MPLHETQQQQAERALLVSVDTGEFDAKVSLDELCELAATAGAEVVGTAIQKKESPDKATCLGSGRAEELARDCAAQDIDLLIVDRELTPTQQRNLEDIFPCRVIDRTTLILDIFAGRARAAVGAVAEEETHEGLVEEDAGDVERGEVVGEAGRVEVDLRGEDADDRGVVGRDESVHQRVGNQVLRRVR